MSTPWTISGLDGTLYTVVTDVSTRYEAVITGTVTDEILGGFAIPGLTVTVNRGGLQWKGIPGGLWAVTGYPSLAFPNPTPVPVVVTLAAPGFRPATVTLAISSTSVFPADGGTTAMRRLPVRLQGRVVQDANGQPVGAAVVLSVDNPTPPLPPPPPPVPHTLLLRSPLYAAHLANATLKVVSLTQTGTAQLLQAAAAGTTTLQLNTAAGLSGSAFVQILTPGAVLVEYAVVTGQGPLPGQVTLATPLNRSYDVGALTIVNFVTATATGIAAHLLLDADAGDGVIVADALLTGIALAIDEGTPAVEYHELGALTDSSGYYACDGVGRVRELFLQANGTGTPVPWAVAYDRSPNVVDFRI